MGHCKVLTQADGQPPAASASINVDEEPEPEAETSDGDRKSVV